MKIDWIRVAGFATTVLVILVFSTMIVRYEFPAFEPASPSEEIIEIETGAIGPEVSTFMWTYRLIDLIAQAFVLFASAACCVAVLRAEEKK